MTNQEIFNKVARHLLTQGRLSTALLVCAYRGSEGLKCAIGCLISDEAYSASIERLGVRDVNVQKALTKSGVMTDRVNLNLLEDLQSVHDHIEVDGWREALQRVAKNHNLTMPEDV